MTKSTDTLRRAAKSLKKDFLRGGADARTRVHALFPGVTDLRHSQALHVIAREEGAASWPKLKFDRDAAKMDRDAKIHRLKIAILHGQNWVTDRLLSETPDLTDGLLGLQVALYDIAGVRAHLERDPTAATRLYGPRRPMLHLAFSKYHQAHPELRDAMIGVAELLVTHGADVNDTTPVAPDNDHPLSALYGAIGHADNMVLGRWLLERGANPDDGESLYHATELGHHEGLRLLLAHGADPKGTNALLRAMDFNDHEAVRMLIDAGAHPDDYAGEPVGGETPWVVPALHQAARRMSDGEMISLLLDGGADPTREFEGATAYAYARIFGNRALVRALEARGPVPALSAVEATLAAAADGSLELGTYVDTAKIPETYRNMIRMILHLPGKLDHVKRLVGIGVEYDRADAEGLTPVQVAGWEGLPEVLSYVLGLKPDLSHVNGYGGTLLSTIIHGSENCPQRADRDHIACARLALEEGVALPKRAIEFAGDADMVEFLADWGAAHPGQVVEDGVG